MSVNFALIFITLAVIGGIAIDAGMLERRYLQMQSAAQAAAVAAALQQNETQTSQTTAMAQAAAASNGFTNGSNGVSVTVQNPPSSGLYAGNSKAFLVTVSQPVLPIFLQILGLGSINVKAQAVQAAGTSVSISGFNVYAIVTDGSTIQNGGLDNSGYALSANAINYQYNGMSNGSRLSWRGQLFYTAAPNIKNGIANTTLNLSSGNYSQLLMLATTAYGPIQNLAFVVTYTDGTTANATFTMSDWCTPSNNPNETIVASQSYRDNQSGGTGPCATYIYGYSMNLNSSKSVNTLKLPANNNAVVLALDLVP